jgi:transmembrane sensor
MMMKAERRTTDMHSAASAEEWFARLSADDVSAADRIAFENWRSARPENDAAYREVERLWRRSGALHRYPDVVGAMDEPPARRAPRWRLPLAAAATVVLAVAVGLLQPWNLLPAGGERVATVTEQRNLMLADGSTVLLDADSELRVRYRENERRVVLGKGRAQFTVAHDPQRPFVVKAGGGTVKALGTRFQVSLAGSAVTVTLLEGRVSIETESTGEPRSTAHKPPSTIHESQATGHRPHATTLNPGEQLSFDTRRESWTRQPVDVVAAQQWIKGDLVFEEWRLAAFVNEMNRYSDTKIHIADESIENLMISGRFHTGDQDSMVRMLETGWPVDARPVSDNEVVLSRR